MLGNAVLIKTKYIKHKAKADNDITHCALGNYNSSIQEALIRLDRDRDRIRQANRTKARVIEGQRHPHPTA